MTNLRYEGMGINNKKKIVSFNEKVINKDNMIRIVFY
jgi:hypothetical protein